MKKFICNLHTHTHTLTDTHMACAAAPLISTWGGHEDHDADSHPPGIVGENVFAWHLSLSPTKNSYMNDTHTHTQDVGMLPGEDASSTVPTRGRRDWWAGCMRLTRSLLRWRHALTAASPQPQQALKWTCPITTSLITVQSCFVSCACGAAWFALKAIET